MRQIFQTEELNRSFIENGYVIIDLLSSAQVAALQELFNQEKFIATGEFYLTIWKDPQQHRLMIHEQIQQIIAGTYEHLLNEYKPIVSSFAVKQPGPDSAWHPHQDDTFVEETNFVSLSIWVPLIDTNATNGTMRVWPGSHRIYTGPRSPNIPKPFANGQEDITNRFTDINLHARQAIIFDHRLVHESRPNNSDKPRVAVVTVLIPREADLIYIYLDKKSAPAMIREYAISERYYLEAPLGEYSEEPDPAKFRLLTTYPYIDFATISKQR